jgi:hypothetical protein
MCRRVVERDATRPWSEAVGMEKPVDAEPGREGGVLICVLGRPLLAQGTDTDTLGRAVVPTDEFREGRSVATTG